VIGRLWHYVKYVARVAYRSFLRFQEHDGPDRAATISYYTLLSLLPLIIFMISLGVLILGSYDAAFKGTLLIVRGAVIPLDRNSIAALHDFVEHATRFRLPGLFLLAWTSRRIFASLISALEKVFGVPGRGFARHNLLALSMVLVMGMVMLVTMAMSLVTAASEGLIERFSGYGAVTLLGTVLIYRLLPAMVTFGFFFLIYRMVPRRVVSGRHAATGALLATVMWELAKKGFSYYVRNLVRYAGVYGALEGVIVLAVWLELSASIILYCGEVVALITAPARLQRRIAFEPLDPEGRTVSEAAEQKKGERADQARQGHL
jgi:membrane protein